MEWPATIASSAPASSSTATGRWKELTEVLRREIQLAESDEEVVNLQFRLGQTLEDALDDKKGAIEVYREILTANPAHAPTHAALEGLFFEGPAEDKLQTEIAGILEPLYETAGEFEKLHRIYEVQLGKLTVQADRAAMITTTSVVSAASMISSATRPPEASAPWTVEGASSSVASPAKNNRSSIEVRSAARSSGVAPTAK